MAKETPQPSHELALAVLEAAAQEGTLSEAHKARLAELAGQAVRSDVTETLAAREAQSPAKAPAIIMAQSKFMREVIERHKLEEKYVEAVETQKFYELPKSGESVPDFSQILKVLNEDLLDNAQYYEEPKLILTTKGRSFEDLIDALNSHKTESGQKDAKVAKAFNNHALRKAENWGAYIVDGGVGLCQQDFEFDLLCVEHCATMNRRLERFAQYKDSRGSGGMNRIKYMHLVMQALRRGEPIDVDEGTNLDEDPLLSSRRYPRGAWDQAENRLMLYCDRPGEVWSNMGYLRRSLGGEIPNA